MTKKKTKTTNIENQKYTKECKIQKKNKSKLLLIVKKGLVFIFFNYSIASNSFL